MNSRVLLYILQLDLLILWSEVLKVAATKIHLYKHEKEELTCSLQIASPYPNSRQGPVLGRVCFYISNFLFQDLMD